MAETTGRAHSDVHVIETGRLVANKTFLRGEGFASLLRRVELFEFPALAYVIEHPEGLTVVDTGLGTHIPKPRTVRGFPPTPATTPEQEIGPQMRQRGLDPEDVRRVVITHLDWDHTGGLRHFHEPRCSCTARNTGSPRRGWAASAAGRRCGQMTSRQRSTSWTLSRTALSR